MPPGSSMSPRRYLSLDQSEILNGCVTAHPCRRCWKFSVFSFQPSSCISNTVFIIHVRESLGTRHVDRVPTEPEAANYLLAESS